MTQAAWLVERRGKPLPANLIETYRRLIKHGLPSAKERMARKGLTKSEIARLTGTSRTTVKKYVANLLEQQERIKKAPPDGQMPDGVP